MIPINFVGSTHRYRKPENWDEATQGPCGTLSTFRDKTGNIISVWRPTAEEREQIYMDGHNVVLT